MGSNRRDFIKFVVAGAVASGCPIDLTQLAQAATHPIRHKLDTEENVICHKVRDGVQFERPPVSGRHELVIIGGGMSGMTAAYRSLDRDFLLLEKESYWGGNAYEMEFEGNYYATGAAFVESDVAGGLAKELGLAPLPISNWDGSIIKGEFVADFWGAGIDKAPYPDTVKESFKKFRSEMMKIDFQKRAVELDNLPFTHFMNGYSPEVKQWWDCYGPSNWATLAAETSSLVAIGELQGIAGDDRKDDRTTWPGGLGALSKKLADKLRETHSDRLLGGCTVVAISPQKKEVNVTYMRHGQMKTIAAKAVIMAIPKYITARLVEGLPPAQIEAMRKIRYAPYPVVNLIYDQPVFNKGYDTWCPGNSFTDVIVADWTIRNQAGYAPKHHILTCYTPMRETDRTLFLTEEGTISVAKRVARDVRKNIPGCVVDPVEVHIFRRGHPMFMVTPGNFTHTLPIVRKPFDRVFFANTDSQGPVSTTTGAIQAAERCIQEVADRMKKA